MHEPEGFRGKIGRTRDASQAWYPERPVAPQGAPNIVILYMDDMGWSDPGCFGSEIDTPHIDALAAGGLRFTQFTSHPICSPARAALLTGMNAHAVGSGWLANNSPGYPGYTGEIPRDAATLAETLRAAHYATFMTGKWHNTPTVDSTPSAPKHSWPSQRGFDRFYGFMDHANNYFFPAYVMADNQPIPIDEYPADYYASDDWTNKGIQFVKELRASSATQPFLLYIAYNAVHAPLQAKATDVAKYQGRYDAGWTAIRNARHQRQLAMGLIPPGTKLPPSDSRVPDWKDTDPADRPMLTRHMEVFAAMLDNVDQNIGRLTAFLQQIGELDNTIILFSSDNGGTDAGGELGSFNSRRHLADLHAPPLEIERASAPHLGTARSSPLYPTGWGEVSNTPFPSFKTYTGAGGRRVSFIASWPKRIKDGGAIRTQFAHVTDIMPTLLELAGVPALQSVNGMPAKEMHGRSFASTWFEAAAPPARTEQYYECWSNRAYYRDGWVACSNQKRGEQIDMDRWALHDLRHDFSESEDVGSRHPEVLAELVEAFDRAAWQYFVYPLDNRSHRDKFADLPPAARAMFDLPRTFLPGAQTSHRIDIFPLICGRSYRITVRFSHAAADQGVLWAIGDQTGGMVMYVEAGRLHFHYNGYGDETDLPPVILTPGGHDITLDYRVTGGHAGEARLLIGDQEAVGWTAMSPTLALQGSFEGLDVGLDRRGPVLWRIYRRHGNFRYTGLIHTVTVTPGARVPS